MLIGSRPLSMKKTAASFHPVPRRHCGSPLKLFFFLLLCAANTSGWAIQLDPYPVNGFSRDPFSISLYREERPSFYWVNIGVPDLFFNGVNLISAPPSSIVYSMHSIGYGLRASGWLTDQLRLKTTIPFEANALVDVSGKTQNLTKPGDVEFGATYLFLGKGEAGSFAGVDVWFRLPSGTNPFDLAFPLLSTGKGVPHGAVGLTASQEVGGFSFFQSIHYEKSQALILETSKPLLGAGVFQWPDNIHAAGRIEYAVFHRAQRLVSLYYEMRARISGPMEFNGQPLSYGQNLGQTSDQLFFSSLGMLVRVDKQFSAEGTLSYFPFEFSKPRPDFGLLFSLSLIFRPI